MLYENKWNTSRTRTAAVSSHRTASKRLSSLRSCRHPRRFQSLDNAMEKTPPAEWSRRSEGQAASRPKTQIDRPSAQKTCGFAAERPKGTRFCHRFMDIKPSGSSGSQAVRGMLRPFRYLASAARGGVELSETRTAGKRAGRTGHRAMAQAGLAPYKKKPAEAAEPLYWLMKAVLCFSQSFVAPGLRKVKHLSNIAGTEEIGCLLFPQSVFPPNIIDWVCAFPFGIAILGWMILRNLLHSFWNALARVLSWFSLVGWSIDGRSEDCIRDFPNESVLNGFLLMRRNLIRLNRSGIGLSMLTLQIIFLRMWRSCAERYAVRCGIPVVSRNCLYRSLSIQNWRSEERRVGKE